MEAGGDMGQGQGRGAKFPTRTCEGYDANDGAAWGGERRREILYKSTASFLNRNILP